jgi:hypothetical protein
MGELLPSPHLHLNPAQLVVVLPSFIVGDDWRLAAVAVLALCLSALAAQGSIPRMAVGTDPRVGGLGRERGQRAASVTVTSSTTGSEDHHASTEFATVRHLRLQLW